MKKTPTRNRARLEILNYILCFSTNRIYTEKKEGYENALVSVETAFFGSHFKKMDIPIGSLVLLTSAGFSKYYLSWLRDYKEEGFGGSWLLESIEDGSLCWWSNVMIYGYPKSQSDKFPQWQWDDDQWAFWDKWNRACKRRDAYITLPVPPVFTDDGGVILGTRTRFSLDSHRPTRKFSDWKKVKVSEMLEFYDYAASSKQPTKEAEGSVGEKTNTDGSVAE